jgi:hypothetical protein
MLKISSLSYFTAASEEVAGRFDKKLLLVDNFRIGYLPEGKLSIFK